MSEKMQQTRENHTKYDPAYHFFLTPVSLFLLIWAIVNLVRHPSNGAVMLALLALVVLVSVVKARVYSLKVQDRLIRLEERLRLASLLDGPQRARIGELTESQLIALRFASDTETPGLVARVLNEQLNAKAIKAAIQHWRGDYFRV